MYVAAQHMLMHSLSKACTLVKQLQRASTCWHSFLVSQTSLITTTGYLASTEYLHTHNPPQLTYMPASCSLSSGALYRLFAAA